MIREPTQMPKIAPQMMRNKTSVGLLVMALVVGGISAQATGLSNRTSGGYLICVHPKTHVMTLPTTSKCLRGYKKLILGAKGRAGTAGITGAAGLSGVDGKNGLDGRTLWNGITDPAGTWGAPGDMYMNSLTMTLFGPKDLTTGWPQGASTVGPKGDQGPIGLTGVAGPQGPGGSGPAGATGPVGPAGNGGSSITELFLCDGPDAGTVADEKCKIGMTGPGGGLIFFVDYNDQYAGFNYLEAAPSSCEASRTWASSGFQATSVPAATGRAARAVGRGSANTNAIVAADSAGTSGTNASKYARSCSSGSKTDWFLGSLGEMVLMNDNLQGLGGFGDAYYLSSSENELDSAWGHNFDAGYPGYASKNWLPAYVRPVRAF